MYEFELSQEAPSGLSIRIMIPENQISEIICTQTSPEDCHSVINGMEVRISYEKLKTFFKVVNATI
jgi:hypothetical protein